MDKIEWRNKFSLIILKLWEKANGWGKFYSFAINIETQNI